MAWFAVQLCVAGALLFGGASAREVYPSSLLPDEVEYIVATDDGSLGHAGFVTELVPKYEAWADQAFACGPAGMLRALSALAVGRRERLGVAKLGRKRGGQRSNRRPEVPLGGLGDAEIRCDDRIARLASLGAGE